MDHEANAVEFVDLNSELEHINQSLEIFPEASVRRETVNNFIQVLVTFRKCLCLKVVLQHDYPKVWPISHKMLAYEITTNIKPARQNCLKEFLNKQDAVFNSIIDSSSYGKCSIHKMVGVTISTLAEDMLLCESLDALETQSKNKTLIENELSLSSLTIAATDESSNAASPAGSPKRAPKSKPPAENKKQQKNVSAKMVAAAAKDEEEPQKAKFRGADYIFDRIKWDESIDTDQVVIGYLDRFLGIKEIKFNDFKHVHDDYREGVPMHRIRHFRINGVIVYDRDKKLDILTGESDIGKFFQNPTAAKPEAGGSAKNGAKPEHITLDRMSEAPILEWTGNEWQEAAGSKCSTSLPAPFSSGIKLLTYNIMSKVNFKHCITALARDHANPVGAEGIYEFDRMSKIINTIASADQDFVLLQECDEYEELKLREHKFIRANYFICSNPFRDCIILSKLKPKWHKLLRLSDEKLGKLAVLTKFQVRSSSFKKVEEILIVNVHLSSDKSNNFLEKRKAQLQILKQFLIDQPDEHDLTAEHTIIAGDFNFGDESSKENATVGHFFVQNGFRDMAPSVSTFDPKSNFSAAIASTKTFGRRMDRIYLRSLKQHKTELSSLNLIGTAPMELRRKSAGSDGSDDFVIFYEPYMRIETLTRAESVDMLPAKLASRGGDLEVSCLLPELVAKEPERHYLHPSDHYGIQCQVKFKNSLTDSNLIHQSTLAILVPKGELTTELIQEIRAKHDPQYERWPAHMNMFYPFWSNIDPVRHDDEDGEVIGDILSTLSQFRPFECDMNEFQAFAKNNVIFLEPSKESQQAISAVYKSLKTLFEDENHRTWKKEMTAHLTIAQPEDKRKAPKDWLNATMTVIKETYQSKLTELKQQGKNKFWVDCVYWMTRSGNKPFEVQFAFPLGSRYPHTAVGLSSEHFFSSQRDNILKFLHDKGALADGQSEKHQFKAYESVLKSLVSSLRNPMVDTYPAHAELNQTSTLDFAKFNQLSLFANKKLNIIGSFLLGVEVHDLDLGLVVIESTESFGDEVTDEVLVRKLAESDVVYTIRNISDAVVPIVEITLNSGSKFNSADVQLYTLPHTVASFLDVNQLGKHYFSSFQLMNAISDKVSDYAKYFALSGLFENQNIKRYIRSYKDFQVVLSFVKLWAQSRGVYGKAFGYFSGITLALMTAFYLKKMPTKYLEQPQLDNCPARFEKLIIGFFKFYQSWNWSTPISLVELEHVAESTKDLVNRPQTRPSVSVLQTVFPYHNTTRNVTTNSLHVIKNELTRVVNMAAKLELGENGGTGGGNMYELAERACETPSLEELTTSAADAKFIKLSVTVRSARDLSHVTSLVKGRLYPLLKTVDNTCSSGYRVYSNFFGPANANNNSAEDAPLVLVISLDNNSSAKLNESERNYIRSNCDELKRNSLAATHIPFDISYEISF